MTQILEAVSIVKSFGAIRVLEDVSVTVNKGEIVGLLGPNGAGKTTMFNLIAGLYQPSEGEIILDGEDVTIFLNEPCFEETEIFSIRADEL